MSSDRQPDLLRGAIAGLAAGIAAALAMDLAQWALAKMQPEEGEASEPATEKAVDRVAEAVGGAPVPKAEKPLAGQAVHYTFGALLGAGYGIAAEYDERVTAGAGSVLGVGSALLFDEAAVPAAGLGEAPWDASASTHLYSMVSHLIYGMVAEGTRRLTRSLI